MAAAALEYNELLAALGAIIAPQSVFEIRLLGMRRKRTDGGYFNSVEACATSLSELSEPYKGIYITPNPVMPDLLARAHNRIKPWVEYTTDDKLIVRRKWLLIDIDPERPADISSTNLEHKRAVQKAREIAGMLDIEYGWCDPMINSSGNGAHVMYPIDLPNDEETKNAIQRFLKSLASRYDEPGCKVDTGMFNASRIWRLPGTYARKGDNTPERPHRKSKVLQLACDYDTVTFKQIQEFTDANPVRDAGSGGSGHASGASNTSQTYPEGEQLFRGVNNHAMRRLAEWVPAYFPGARPYKGGFRISSQELGRDREEDLTIHPFPMGIKDFGEHDADGEQRDGRRTPVSVIAEFHFEGDIKAAAKALSDTLQVPLTEFDEIPSAEIDESDKSYDEVFGDGKFDFSRIRSYADLSGRTFAELKWIIPNVLPVGCFVLAARPKMRKTWLALQLCCAVATGGKFLDWKVNKGKALMLALEDNERRIKSRIETLYTFDGEIPRLNDFMYFTDGSFPKGEDGIAILDQYYEMNPDLTFVVIDTLAHYRKATHERDVYQKDYQALMPITRWAAKRQVCVMVVTHEKKGLADTKSGDFIEDVTGSAGITGAVDGIMSIKGRRGIQEENESRKLMITGRDVPNDYELDMSFDAELGGWRSAARQDIKTSIRLLFKQQPYMMRSEILAWLPGVPQARVTRALMEMKFEGEVEQNKNGYSMRIR